MASASTKSNVNFYPKMPLNRDRRTSMWSTELFVANQNIFSSNTKLTKPHERSFVELFLISFSSILFHSMLTHKICRA